MTGFYIGLDLGQQNDYTAIIILEEVLVSSVVDERIAFARGVERAKPQEPEYHLRHIERFHLGTPYTSVAERVAALVGSPPLADNNKLIVDQTGVGAPVVDLLKKIDRAGEATALEEQAKTIRDAMEKARSSQKP